MSINDQIGLLQNGWSEVLTLSLVFRSLPSTVAAGAARDKESATMGSVKRQLKFAPDYTLNYKTDLYEQVSNILRHPSKRPARPAKRRVHSPQSHYYVQL